MKKIWKSNNAEEFSDVYKKECLYSLALKDYGLMKTYQDMAKKWKSLTKNEKFILLYTCFQNSTVVHEIHINEHVCSSKPKFDLNFGKNSINFLEKKTATIRHEENIPIIDIIISKTRDDQEKKAITFTIDEIEDISITTCSHGEKFLGNTKFEVFIHANINNPKL